MKRQMEINANRNTIINTVRTFILDTKIINEPFNEIDRGSIVIFSESWWSAIKQLRLERQQLKISITSTSNGNIIVFESNAMNSTYCGLLSKFLRAAEALGKNAVTYSE